MEPQNLAQLIEAAADADEPQVVARLGISPGGVDPLGLRQINFDLMDLVIPSLNNVATHIRPFTVIAWAWHRAALCAQKAGRANVSLNELQDFVDRVEVIFAWSQFIRNADADLPGRDVLAHLLKSERYSFGGEEWQQRRETRRFSTALSAPVNYGPAVKQLRWIEPSLLSPGAFKSTEKIKDALLAFDAVLVSALHHPAFSKFGKVTVSRTEAADWATAFALDKPTGQERAAMRESLTGDGAQELGNTLATIKAIVAHSEGQIGEDGIRASMCNEPSGTAWLAKHEPVPTLWSVLQVRQLFRLALEALLQWSLIQLSGGPAQPATLANRFVDEAGSDLTTQAWLSGADVGGGNIVESLRRLEKSLSSSDGSLAPSILGALAMSLSDARPSPVPQRLDRLPLSRAREEAETFKAQPPAEFVKHVLTSWILGQHVYWSIGRGLADARNNGKTILRLRVVPEEAGWTLAPGAGPNFANPPRATADRLYTLLSLAREAGYFGKSGLPMHSAL